LDGAADARRLCGTVTVELTGEIGDQDRVVAQVERILSLDVDGRGFPELGRRDPVVGELLQRYPGLRPVLFCSPYEAACWSIIGQRLRITQAAAIKQRLADQLGDRVTVAGQQLTAFPAPQQLRGRALPGLPQVKVERLDAIATAALSGQLDTARLRDLDTDQALEELTRLPGIGPFSAELILARGAGHPDLFPTAERRLHAEIAGAYRLTEPTVARLADVADGWRPYRTWVGLLLRTRREATPTRSAGAAVPIVEPQRAGHLGRRYGSYAHRCSTRLSRASDWGLLVECHPPGVTLGRRCC
jgi:DNA-3-methyladenine glycosylase II